MPGFSGPLELAFDVLCGEVCDALECAVLDMKKGERAVVTAAASKAADPKLGLTEVNAEKVVLTLEIVDFEKGPDVWSLEAEEKLKIAAQRKDVGAKLFAAKRFELALEKYSSVFEAANYVSADNCKDEALKAHGADLKKAAELNKAACFLKFIDLKLGSSEEALKSCVDSCNKVLETDTSNPKALFRRAKARYLQKLIADAAADIEALLRVDSNNAEAKNLQQHIARAQKLEDKKSKATFARMCQGLGKLGSESRSTASGAPEVKLRDEVEATAPAAE